MELILKDETRKTVIQSAGDFTRGAHFFFLGMRLILKPTLKRYLFVPIIVNALILILTFSLLGYFLYHYVQSFIGDLPNWMVVLLGWLFWILYGITSLLIGTVIFTLVANLIASPFYGLLAEATAKLLPGRLQNPSFSPVELSFKTILLLIPHSVGRELRKLLHFIPWLLLAGLCLIFPFTWPLFPFLWWIVTAWIFGVEYTDYQADNQSMPFQQTLSFLKANKMQIFGFGSMVSVAMLIPGANLFVPAIAVSGGTALWLSIQSNLAFDS